MFQRRIPAWLLASSVALAAFATAAQPKTGRTVAELLREAAREGIQIVFSDQLVPPGLKVRSEPTATDTLTSLREVLASHGLALEEVGANAYVVTRATRRPVPETQPPAVPPIELAEVQVVASRYTVEIPRADAPFELDADEMRRQPALFDDATRSVRRFPGTSGTGLSSRTHVRGGAADENLLLLDGMPLDNPFHLPGLPADLSAIDPVLLDRVDFYSGVLPVEHSGRMSGLIDMRTRPRAGDFGGRFALGFVGASALLEAPLSNGRGDVVAFGRRGMLDQVARVVDEEFGKPVFVDTFARVRYDIAPDSTLTASALAAGDDIDLADGRDGEVVSSESDRRYFWLTHDLHREQVHARTILGHTSWIADRSGERQEAVGELGFVRDARRSRMTVLKHDWEQERDRHTALRWGAAVRRDEAEFDYDRDVVFPEEVAALFGRPAVSRSQVDTSVSLTGYEAYAGFSRALGARWALDVGLHWTRAEYSTGQDDSEIDPRIGLLCEISPQTRWRLSWGLMTQTWSASDLPVEREQVLFDERPRNRMQVLAFEHDWANGVSLRAEAYQKDIHRPAPRVENILNPIVLVPELRPDRVVIDPDRTRVTGLDVYATGRFGNVEGWLSYSWSHARDVIDGRDVSRAWDQRHALSLGFGFEYRAWMFSGVLTGRSGWPVAQLLEDPEPPGIRVAERRSNGDRVFVTLDLKAERRFDFGPGSLHVALELANATDRSNYCCTELEFERDTSGNLLAREKQKFWLPLVPYASLAWEF